MLGFYDTTAMEFSPEFIFIFILIAAIVISTLVSMVGLGGGILYLPMLIFIFNLPVENAVAVSLCGMTATTTSATIAYWNQNKINIKLAFIYNILDIPGVFLGAYFTLILPSNILSVIAGIIMIVLVSLLLKKKAVKKDECISDETDESFNKRQPNEGPDKRCEESPLKRLFNGKKPDEIVKSAWKTLWKGIPHPSVVLLSSFVGGFITGLVGIGGGTADTSSMIIIGIPVDVAAATSAFAMMMTNIVAVSTHGAFGNILWEYAIPLAIGAFFGAQIGGRLSKRMKADALKLILCGFALFSGIRLIIDGLF